MGYNSRIIGVSNQTDCWSRFYYHLIFAQEVMSMASVTKEVSMAGHNEESLFELERAEADTDE